MDLANGARKLIVLMEHVTRSGEPKLVQKCSYPLTGAHCVDLVVTDLAVVAVTPDGFELREVAPGITPEDIEGLTDAPLRRSSNLREMEF
jgi:3-oxoacid CoA-transferase subunit B